MHRAADDRVHEVERAAVGQDPARAQRVGGLGGLAVVELRDRRGVPDEGAVPQDRGRADEPPGRLGEAGKACPNRRDHAVGRRAQHVGGACRAGLAQRARQLAQEERVAAGQRMAAAAERRHGLGDDAADELRRGAVAERVEPQQRGRTGLGQQLGHGGAARLAGRPRGDHEHHRFAADPPGQVREEPQRRRVGPVRVVDEQRQRLLPGEIGGEAIEPVQHGERPLRPERQRVGLRRRDVEQRRRMARRTLERRRAVAVVDRGLEQLPRDAEPERPLELRAPGAQQPQPRLGAQAREPPPAERSCRSPAAPSTTTARPSPAATASAVARITLISPPRSRSSPSSPCVIVLMGVDPASGRLYSDVKPPPSRSSDRYCGEGKIDSVRPVRSSSSRSA